MICPETETWNLRMTSATNGDVMKKKKLYKSRNGFYVSLLVLIIGGYLFFWNSKSLFQKNEITVTPTELGTEISYKDREIKLIRWDYSETQNLCEIELDIMNTAFDGQKEYAFKAYYRQDGKEEELKVKEIIHDATSAVVHLMDVPQDYAEICLHLIISDQNDTTPLKLYATRDSVCSVDDIKELTREEYQRERILLQINEYELTIEENNKRVEVLRDKISTTNEQIEELESSIPYQAAEKQRETKLLIDKADDEIAQAWAEIESCEKENSELKVIIADLQKKYEEGR